MKVASAMKMSYGDLARFRLGKSQVQFGRSDGTETEKSQQSSTYGETNFLKVVFWDQAKDLTRYRLDKLKSKKETQLEEKKRHIKENIINGEVLKVGDIIERGLLRSLYWRKFCFCNHKNH